MCVYVNVSVWTDNNLTFVILSNCEKYSITRCEIVSKKMNRQPGTCTGNSGLLCFTVKKKGGNIFGICLQPGTCTGDSSLLLCTVGKSTSSAKTASGSMIYMNFYSMTTECLCVAENRGYIEIKHR